MEIIELLWNLCWIIICFNSTWLSPWLGRWLTIRHFHYRRHFVWIFSILTIRHFHYRRHFVWIISILTIRHFYWAFCLVLRIFCSDHFVSISYLDLVFWPFCVYVSDLRIISAHLEYLLGTYHSDPLLLNCLGIIFAFCILFFENCLALRRCACSWIAYKVTLMEYKLWLQTQGPFNLISRTLCDGLDLVGFFSYDFLAF